MELLHFWAKHAADFAIVKPTILLGSFFAASLLRLSKMDSTVCMQERKAFLLAGRYIKVENEIQKYWKGLQQDSDTS